MAPKCSVQRAMLDSPPTQHNGANADDHHHFTVADAENHFLYKASIRTISREAAGARQWGHCNAFRAAACFCEWSGVQCLLSKGARGEATPIHEAMWRQLAICSAGQELSLGARANHPWQLIDVQTAPSPSSLLCLRAASHGVPFIPGSQPMQATIKSSWEPASQVGNGMQHISAIFCGVDAVAIPSQVAVHLPAYIQRAGAMAYCVRRRLRRIE